MKFPHLIQIILVAALFASCKPHYNEHPAIYIKEAVTDVDGNIYDAVKIGDQVWMASNLRTTRYADGQEIELGENRNSDSIAYRYAPSGLEENVAQFGYLYNWPAVMHGAHFTNDCPSGVQGICPDGWHVPSNTEWKVMDDYVSKDADYMHASLSVAKALAAPYGWDTTYLINTPGRDVRLNNSTGLSVLPAGYFVFGDYNDQGQYAYYWTTMRSANYFGGGHVIGFNTTDPCSRECSLFYGLSVRCVQD